MKKLKVTHFTQTCQTPIRKLGYIHRPEQYQGTVPQTLDPLG